RLYCRLMPTPRLCLSGCVPECLYVQLTQKSFRIDRHKPNPKKKPVGMATFCPAAIAANPHRIGFSETTGHRIRAPESVAVRTQFNRKFLSGFRRREVAD